MNATTTFPETVANVDGLSDEALLAELQACVVAARENDTRVLVYLIAVETRRIHLMCGCSSMYIFCRKKLGWSEGQTHRRLASARLARLYPFILPLVTFGVTHMSTLAHIKAFVTPENVCDLVLETAGKTRFEVDCILARRFGHVAPLVGTRGVIVIDEELDALMERAFELVCHAVPNRDPLELAKRAFRALIADAEKKQRAKADNPRPGPARATKTIPRDSTRKMFARHGEQCCYVDAKTGERCESRVFIQRNHRTMRAEGGTHEATNLDSMCGPHNRYLAELALGRERIERAIRLRQRRSAGGAGDGGEEPPA